MRGRADLSARAPGISPKMARRIGWTGLALVIGIYAAFPLYWMIVTALQSGRDLFLWPPHLLPNPRHLSVFERLFATQPIVRWLENSSIVSAGVAVMAVLLSTPGAYGLSRYQRRGWASFGFLLLLTQMLPGIVIITPLFILFRQVHILNSLGALVAVDVAFTAPIVLWVIKGFFDTIPFEIEEAALLDGCSPLETLLRIAVPLSAPALGGALTIAFFTAWNEYLFALVMVSDQSRWVASVGVASWIGELTTPTEVTMAGAIVFAIPSVLLFMYLQRYLVLGTAKLGSVR
jgi:multiple sugar transport system permease protein